VIVAPFLNLAISTDPFLADPVSPPSLAIEKNRVAWPVGASEAIARTWLLLLLPLLPK
jgi:hypothetical protein